MQPLLLISPTCPASYWLCQKVVTRLHLWSVLESSPHTSKQQIPGSIMSYNVWSNITDPGHMEPLGDHFLSVCHQSFHGSLFYCGPGWRREANATQQTHTATLSTGCDLWHRRPALGADGLWWCTAADIHIQTKQLGGTVWCSSTNLDFLLTP